MFKKNLNLKFEHGMVVSLTKAETEGIGSLISKELQIQVYGTIFWATVNSALIIFYFKKKNNPRLTDGSVFYLRTFNSSFEYRPLELPLEGWEGGRDEAEPEGAASPSRSENPRGPRGPNFFAEEISYSAFTAWMCSTRLLLMGEGADFWMPLSSSALKTNATSSS